MNISILRKDVPDWVMKNWLLRCPYCGDTIFDNGDTGATTARWCPNRRCPGHMSYKMVELAKFFGIKGIGPKTALSIIQSNKLQSHLQIIPIWFKEEKPIVRLPDVVSLACIRGLGSTTAESELGGYASIEEYLDRCPEPNKVIIDNWKELSEAQQYFIVKPPLSKNKIRVMATDSFYGYVSREEYFEKLNDLFGGAVHIIQTGKRKTGVSYLVCEEGASDSAKMGIARDMGIPIVTPAQFVYILYVSYPGVVTKEQYEAMVLKSINGGAHL